MTDVVETMRDLARIRGYTACADAADEIESLRSRLAEIERDFHERMTKALLVNERRPDKLTEVTALLRNICHLSYGIPYICVTRLRPSSQRSAHRLSSDPNRTTQA